MPLLIDGKGRGVTTTAKQKRAEGPPAESVTAEIAGARQLPAPNQALLGALARVEQIQQGMSPADDLHSLEYLREARAGGMYGCGPDE